MTAERHDDRIALRTHAMLAAMADGIGEHSFASAAWVVAARMVADEQAQVHATALADAPPCTICEVAHNPPAWLHAEASLAWHLRIANGRVHVEAGNLPATGCDFRAEGEHSIMSNLAHIQYAGREPALVADVQARFARQSRWDISGALPQHAGLRAFLGAFHDRMAALTMPRYVFMTPMWVSSTRHILCTRASSPKYAAALQGSDYTFAEEFTHTPAYGFPDGAHGGFWVRCEGGRLTVGAGALPAALEPADALTKGQYTPVVPVGRTVNAAMTEDEVAMQAAYSKRAFRFDKQATQAPVSKTSPSGRGDMPAVLARVFLPLHDELSKRTSGELPSDFIAGIRDEWAAPQGFDRAAGFDAAWLRYDKVDLFGDPR